MDEARVGDSPGLTIRDMVCLVGVGGPKASPDGLRAVLPVTRPKNGTNRKTTSLYLLHPDGSRPPQQLTNPAEGISDSSPVWLNNNTIAFLSNRNEKQGTQIWTISTDGGEAAQLTQLPTSVSNLQACVIGNAGYLSFTANVYPDMTLEMSAKKEKEAEEDVVKAKVFDSLMVRHWDSWKGSTVGHIFVLPVQLPSPQGRWCTVSWESEEKASNEDSAVVVVDLMQGMNLSVNSYAWHPKGSHVAFEAEPDYPNEGLGPLSQRAWKTKRNIYVLDVEGIIQDAKAGKEGGDMTENMKCITQDKQGINAQPAFSPSGDFISYLSMERGGYEADLFELKMYNTKTGMTQNCIKGRRDEGKRGYEWDLSVSSATWATEDEIIIAVTEEARGKLFNIDLKSGLCSLLVSNHTNWDVSILHRESTWGIAFLRSSFNFPAEAWVCADIRELQSLSKDATDKERETKMKKLTFFNDTVPDSFSLSQGEDFWFEGANGDSVHSWFFPPVGWVGGATDKKWPLAVFVHGGPQGCISDAWNYRWNPQMYTAAGYAFFTVNFHGSSSFGQKFIDSINCDWGGKPYEDVMKGIDAILQKYEWLDSQNMCALGASYGGWMMNWINGQTDRFKCLVVHDGIFDQSAFYFTTEELWFPEWDMGGTPWDNREQYDRWSPARHVTKWKTPSLIIHGGKDYRCPETEGIAAFNALQRRGIPSRFLYFPDEGHWVLKPQNSIKWHDTVLAWLGQWTGTDTLS